MDVKEEQAAENTVDNTVENTADTAEETTEDKAEEKTASSDKPAKKSAKKKAAPKEPKEKKPKATEMTLEQLCESGLEHKKITVSEDRKEAYAPILAFLARRYESRRDLVNADLHIAIYYFSVTAKEKGVIERVEGQITMFNPTEQTIGIDGHRYKLSCTYTIEALNFNPYEEDEGDNSDDSSGDSGYSRNSGDEMSSGSSYNDDYENGSFSRNERSSYDRRYSWRSLYRTDRTEKNDEGKFYPDDEPKYGPDDGYASGGQDGGSEDQYFPDDGYDDKPDAYRQDVWREPDSQKNRKKNKG